MQIVICGYTEIGMTGVLLSDFKQVVEVYKLIEIFIAKILNS